MIRTFHHHKFAKSQLILYSRTVTSTHPRLLPMLDVQTGKGSLRILWASILKRKKYQSFFSSAKKKLLKGGGYETVTYPFMDSSKFYNNREPSTFEYIGYSRSVPHESVQVFFGVRKLFLENYRYFYCYCYCLIQFVNTLWPPQTIVIVVCFWGGPNLDSTFC